MWSSHIIDTGGVEKVEERICNQIRTPLNPGLNSWAPKEETIPAPLMAPVVLL
jgi:hypothetical protein